jgi:hypothetical protein
MAQNKKFYFLALLLAALFLVPAAYAQPDQAPANQQNQLSTLLTSTK